MNPGRVFYFLLAAGLVAGGWLYGDYWKKSGALDGNTQTAAELRAQNSELTQEIDRLEEELAQVRSMLSSGPYPVPDTLISWVEKEHAMVFLKAPDVRLAPPADLREAAHNNLQLVHGEKGLEHESLAWELLGILPPNQKLLNQLLFVNSSGLKGIFEYTKGRILLAENFDPVSVPDRSVLVRLLGQQLSFQNHPQKSWDSRDHWQAWEAVHVGSAAALQARFLKANAAANEAAWGNPEPNREALLNDLSPALQGFCNFPFLEGADYTRFFYLDSRQAFSEMFRSPPTDTRQILHPNHNPIPPAEPERLPESGELVFSNNLGELGLRLWLDPFLGNEEAEQLAETWVGDLYQIRTHERNHILTWQIQLKTEDSAKTLATAIEGTILTAFRELQPIRDHVLDRKGNLITLTNSPKS